MPPACERRRADKAALSAAGSVGVEAEVRGESSRAGGVHEGVSLPQHRALQNEELLRGSPGAPGGPQTGEQKPPA